VTISFSADARMLDCSPRCFLEGLKPATEVARPQFQGSPPTAAATFYVRARSYGVAANGATAAVGFPELDYSATRQAALHLTYQSFPSATSYDWSSLPSEPIDKTLGPTWSETLLPGNAQLILSGGTSGRVATGVNPTAQQRDSNFTLAVGILIGIGGSALVAAVQEALHD
jgi:hypothetical protein